MRDHFDIVLAHYTPLVVDGVEFLNENIPGWSKEDKIDIDTLALNDGKQCVLGQLAVNSAIRSAGYVFSSDEDYGFPEDNEVGYDDAIEALGIEDGDYGFNCNGEVEQKILDVARRHGDDHDATITMRALDELWVSAIRMTRAGRDVNIVSLWKDLYGVVA